jgi:hypothetical protein
VTAEPTHRMLSSRSEFHEALRTAFDRVAAQGCREIWLCDPDLAQHYDEIVRKHPRWVNWRRQWSHVVECRAFEEVESGAMPSMFLAPGVVTVRLFDPENYRASVSTEVADAVRAKEALDVVLQRSSEAFAATTLGL